MRESDRSNIFRLVVVVMTIFIFGISMTSIIRMATSLTDENQFIDPLYRLYVKKEIVGKSEVVRDDKDNEAQDDEELLYKKDTIKVGDLIFAMNKEILEDYESYERFLNSLTDSSEIAVSVFSDKGKSGFRAIKVRRCDIEEGSVVYLESAVYINSVQKGGASEGAGIRKKDYITKINGA